MVVSSLCPLFGTVADLQALQAKHPAVVCQYTFEGSTEAEQLAQKVGVQTPALKQAASDPRRQADFLTPGYDASTRSAVFTAFASGVKGDCLRASAPIRFATSGTLEFLVRLGAANRELVMVAAGASAPSALRRFLRYDGTQAAVALGGGAAQPLFGEGTQVPYGVGDWYYVAIVWSVSGGNLTLNAWVSHLGAGAPKLTQTIVNAVVPFDGEGEATLFLGGLDGAQKFAQGSLDALALYDSALDSATIAFHYDSIIPN